MSVGKSFEATQFGMAKVDKDIIPQMNQNEEGLIRNKPSISIFRGIDDCYEMFDQINNTKNRRI